MDKAKIVSALNSFLLQYFVHMSNTVPLPVLIDLLDDSLKNLDSSSFAGFDANPDQCTQGTNEVIVELSHRFFYTFHFVFLLSHL